ncbi:MAG: hypothetical protein PHI12_10385 [Dehalococcoidales bacterium]|nr:hypothetical protein [Dehalococcoidales bacterium]
MDGNRLERIENGINGLHSKVDGLSKEVKDFQITTEHRLTKLEGRVFSNFKPSLSAVNENGRVTLNLSKALVLAALLLVMIAGLLGGVGADWLLKLVNGG